MLRDLGARIQRHELNHLDDQAMKNQVVSVIIPSFNMAAFLSHAVDSVLGQTYPHIEVHIVDDGSVDDTKAVTARYAGDPRVHYHYQENRGLPAARNTGIRHATGSIIGLCDADDVWVPNKLETQLALFTSPAIGVVYTDAQWIDEKGNRLPTFAWGAREHRIGGTITRQLFVRNIVTGSTSLIRRECFDVVGLYDESLTGAEDYELWLRISTAFEFAYLDEVTYLYRQWGGQMTGNSLKMLDNCTRILEEFQQRHEALLTRQIIAEAWGRLRTDRSLALARSGRRKDALREVAAALRHDPGYPEAWKTAIKILIDRV